MLSNAGVFCEKPLFSFLDRCFRGGLHERTRHPRPGARPAEKIFGFDDFRPGQQEIVEAVLAGDPVLAVMPTGSGKSLCYQLPALIGDGLTLVVSPLIALMRDQVGQMRALGLAAATLNSQTGEAEARETWALIRDGALKLLFLSPERLAMDGLVEALSRARVRRIAVDEAHCICEWGHDFRPEYRMIRQSVEKLGAVQVIAFTATADSAMREEIAERLFDAKPKIFVHSFDRPNISLAFAPKDQPRKQLQHFLQGRRGQSGIVYCASRAGTERLAEHFSTQGFETVAYHAGLEQTQRNANQDRFLREDGVVAFATVAFGMGVNKPDVRFVAHADMPSSMESFYQEIGRAGRDGLPADAFTLYGLEDMALRRRQIDEKDMSTSAAGPSISAFRPGRAVRRRLLPPPDPACPFQRTGAVLRALRRLSRQGRAPRRHDRSAKSAFRGLSHGTALRRRLSLRPPDGRRERGAAPQRPSRAEDLRRRRRSLPAGVDLDLPPTLRRRGAWKRQHEHGGFALTDKGEAILLGRESITLRADPPREGLAVETVAPRARGARRARDDSAEAKIFEALSRLRRDLARTRAWPPT